MTRARTAAYWAIPALICLAVHWDGFRAWFRADDFAWLSLYNRIYSFHDLMAALFTPQAQGTIRPWSERAFFIVGYGLFGLNSLPYRIVIFGTQFGALALTQAVGTRLAGNRAAGFCAAILWTINSSTMEPLGWACVYNEVMCAFFLLLAFFFLLRFIETGARRYSVGEWAAFLVGFGALELNVAYPALAAVYALVCARKYLRRTLPMFGVSAVYAAVHAWAARPPVSGEYAAHFGLSMLRTLAVYWTWSLGPVYLETPPHMKRWMLLAGIAALSLALLAFLAVKLRAGRGAALFCLAWYVVTFAPTLPLSGHLTEYYPYIPVIGLAWLGGWGLGEAWKMGTARRAGALALAAIYAALVLPRTVLASEWNYRWTIRARDLVAGVERAHELHPNDAILLDNADEQQFLGAIRDKAFALLGARVYLTPESESRLTQGSEWGQVSDYALPAAVISTAIERGQAVVYDVSQPVLRNITSYYAALPHASGLPLRVEVSNPLLSAFVGGGWYGIETDHRWMGKRASVRIGAPSQAGGALHLIGYCPPQNGGMQVTVTVDGAALQPETAPTGNFDLAFPLPRSAVGKPELEVTVEASRTFRPEGDPRDLGLSFGVFEIR